MNQTRKVYFQYLVALKNNTSFHYLFGKICSELYRNIYNRTRSTDPMVHRYPSRMRPQALVSHPDTLTCTSIILGICSLSDTAFRSPVDTFLYVLFEGTSYRICIRSRQTMGHMDLQLVSLMQLKQNNDAVIFFSVWWIAHSIWQKKKLTLHSFQTYILLLLPFFLLLL